MIKWNLSESRPSFRRQAALAGCEFKHTTLYVERYVDSLYILNYRDIITDEELAVCLKRIEEKLNEDIREIK